MILLPQYPTLSKLTEQGSQQSRYTEYVSSSAARHWLQTYAPAQFEKLSMIISRWNAIKSSDSRVRQWNKVTEFRMMLSQNHSAALWRGVASGRHVPSIVTPSISARSSKDAHSMYLILSDEANPDWPRRQRSLIATSEEDYAGEFGFVNLVIPRDGAQVASMSTSDFYQSVSPTISSMLSQLIKVVRHDIDPYIKTLPQLAQSRQNLIKAMVSLHPSTNITWDHLVFIFDAITSALNGLHENDLSVDTSKTLSIVKTMMATSRVQNRIGDINDKLLMSVLTKWLNGEAHMPNDLLPVYSYARLTGADLIDASPSASYNGECWTESPCLLIPADHWGVADQDVPQLAYFRDIFIS